MSMEASELSFRSILGLWLDVYLLVARLPEGYPVQVSRRGVHHLLLILPKLHKILEHHFLLRDLNLSSLVWRFREIIRQLLCNTIVNPLLLNRSFVALLGSLP